MKVYIPSPLCSYTHEANSVDAAGGSVGELLEDLDRRFPGIRFRIINEQDEIRRHIRIFVNGNPIAGLSAPLGREDEVMIVCALSGG